MQRHTTRVAGVMAFCLLALWLIPFSALAAKPILKAPAKAVLQEPFTVTVQQAPSDLTWNYDTSKLRLIDQSSNQAVFEPVAEGSARLSASSAQTGWISGYKTVKILPATGSRPVGKPSTPSEPGAAPAAESSKSQAIRQILDNYKKRLGQAGLEDKFRRQGSDTEKCKVNLTPEQAQTLGQISNQFLTEMASGGLTMHDFMEFRRVMGEAAASPSTHALYPGSASWDASYLGTERALMMGRAEMVNQAWIETMSEAYRRHPDWVGVDKGQTPVLYGRMDIGSWVKMDLGGLAFKADIDFSSLATCAAANQEVKAIFAEVLQRRLGAGGDLPKIIDAVLTPHGAAGAEVFIGEWGQAFAEVDMLKRSSWTLLLPEVDADGKPVFEQGRIKLKTKPMSGQALFWERAFRTGQEYKPPKIDINVEPMLSLEMLRHMTADIIHGPAFGRGDKIVKMLKYVERSYFFNKKATAGTGWDPYANNDPDLGSLCNELFKERKEGDKKVVWSKDPEKVAALIEQLAGGPITEGNVEALVQTMADRCRKAIIRNSEMGLSARLRKIADIDDEAKRGKELEKLFTQMDQELDTFKSHDVEVPAEISRILLLAKAFQKGLVGPELIKTVDELRSIYTDVLKLSKMVCDRLLLTDAWGKLREVCKQKLKWKDEQVEKFVKQAREAHPDAAKYCDKFNRFNNRVTEAAAGSTLLSASEWADNSFTVYEAYMSGENPDDAFRKAAWQMGLIFVQNQFPETGIPIAVITSLSEGSPAPLAMAVTFYYFPFLGQMYTLGVNFKRLDVGYRDRGFYDSMEMMLKVTDFDQSGKITRFALRDATGKHARDEAEVSPPGNRQRIVDIFEAPDSTFYVAPNFRYWRALIPNASDNYSYTTKLQNLRRFFPHSDEIKFWTVMLENTKGQQNVPQDQHTVKREELLAQMETQLRAAVWRAMADALESASKSASPAQVEEWQKKIAELEKEFSLGDLDLGRNQGLQSKINQEILQATGKVTQWWQGDNIYAVGQIYEKYIKSYTDLKAIRDQILQVWRDPFKIDSGKVQSKPLKLLLDGNGRLGAPPLNGVIEHDLAAGEKALTAHKGRAAHIKSDLAEALGRPVKVSQDVLHLRILGQYAFEWQHLREDAPEGDGQEVDANVQGAMTARYKNYRRYLDLLKAASTLGIDGPDTLALGLAQPFKATTQENPKILAEFQLMWSDPARVGEGPVLNYDPKKAGAYKLQVTAVAQVEGQAVTLGQAVKDVQVSAAGGVIQLSEPQPAVNQKFTATLVLKTGQPPQDAQVQWRTTGGVKLEQARGLAASLTAQDDGQVFAALMLKGKIFQEFSVPVTPKKDVAGVIELAPPQPAVDQQFTATLVIQQGLAPADAQIQWRAGGGVKLLQARGPNASLAAQDNGQVIAALVQKGRIIKEFSTPVTVTRDDLEAAVELSDSNPPINQKISASLTFRKGKLPPGAAIQWRSTGGLALQQRAGQTISLTARSDGQVVATLVKDGKALKEAAAAVTVKQPDADKKDDTKGAAGEEKAGQFSGKIKAPAGVGSTEIFKATAEVPTDFARRKIEYSWSISDYGKLLNESEFLRTTGPEAVIQPNHEWITKKNLSEMEIRLAVSDLGNGRRNLGEGKIQVKLRPESFSAQAPKSWTGGATRYGVNLNYGKREAASNGLIIGMYSGQVIVDLGGDRVILPSDDEGNLSSQPSGKGNKLNLGDFKGYLEEHPPTANSGGVGTLKGTFSKGKVAFAVQGRVSVSVGAVANQGQIKEAQQRLQSLYQEMVGIVKTIRLGPGGGMAWDPAKDSQTAGDTTKDKPTETTKPLTVRLNAAKKQLLAGEKLPVEAAVENTDPKDAPLTYTWTGEHEGQGARVGFTASKPGKYTLKVEVKSPKGAAGAASLDLEVIEPKVEIVKVSPAGNSIPVGGKAAFQAKFKGASGKSYIYRWQPQPEAAWDNPESPAAQAAATFRRPGPVKVWVTVLEKKGAVLSTVAESPQLSLEVVKPQLKLTFNPMAPMIGQEVRAHLEVTPLPPDLSLRWLPLPANAQLLKESQDGREITFTLKDDKPAPVKVLALVKGPGDSLGEASGTVQAQKFKVAATVVGPLGPEPQKWDPAKGGLAPDPKAIATYQNVRVKAAITPEPPKGPVRWRWSVNPDSHIQSGEGSAEITANRSQTGTCELTVAAEDSQGSKLGEAKTSFQVTVNQGSLAKTLREEAQKKAAEGKLDEAIALMEQAVKLDPASSADANFFKKLKTDKETITRQLEKTNNLISQGKFPEAEKELAAAKGVNAKYPPVAEAEKRLAAAKAGPQKEAKAKLAQAKTLAGQGRLDEAIKLAGEAAKLDPQNSEAPKLAAEWQALKDKVARLKEEGKNLEGHNKLDAAIAKYQEALKLLSDPQLTQHVAELQSRLAKNKQGQELAEKLRKEGEALEGQKKLAEAITKYQESLKQAPDPKLAEHVKALQARLEEEKGKKEMAKRLRDEGAAWQQQGKLAEAIGKYQESLKYLPDPNLEAHIRSLQAKLNQAKQDQVVKDKEKPEKDKQSAANNNKETAKRLRNEGAALQQQSNLAGAIGKYQESLKYLPDPNLESHIRTLQAKLNQAKQDQAAKDKAKQDKDKQAAANLETAKRLLNEGAALEKQGKVAGALAKCKEAYKYLPDPRLKSAIDKLEAVLQASSKAHAATNSGVTGGKYGGNFNGRFTNGRVAFTVTGNQMRGTMNGAITWQTRQFPFTGSVQGTVSPKGEINGSLTGKSQGADINGTFSGRVQGNSAGGTWQAKALMVDNGNWQAKGQ